MTLNSDATHDIIYYTGTDKKERFVNHKTYCLIHNNNNVYFLIENISMLRDFRLANWHTSVKETKRVVDRGCLQNCV